MSDGQYGAGLSACEWKPGDPRYIRITDIDGDGQLTTDRVAPQGDRADWEKSLLRQGHLLFARSGATVGKTYLHKECNDPAVYAGYLIKFELDSSRILPEYAFRYTQTAQYRAWIANAQRAVAQPNINAKQYANLPIPLPPLPEQRRVAAILDHADALRAKRRQVITHFDQLAQAIFHDMFGDPVANDHGYPVQPLSQWVDQGRPITYGILKPGPDIDGGVPYVRVADMKAGGIDLVGIRRTTKEIAAEYRRSRLEVGDLLMSIRGHVGRFAFVPGELVGGNITQDSARLAITEPVSAMYVRTAMEMPSLQHWMARHTKGAAVRGINLGDLKNAPIPCPPIPQQRAFAVARQQVVVQLHASRNQLEEVDRLFAATQSRAFSGAL